MEICFQNLKFVGNNGIFFLLRSLMAVSVAGLWQLWHWLVLSPWEKINFNRNLCEVWDDLSSCCRSFSAHTHLALSRTAVHQMFFKAQGIMLQLLPWSHWEFPRPQAVLIKLKGDTKSTDPAQHGNLRVKEWHHPTFYFCDWNHSNVLTQVMNAAGLCGPGVWFSALLS